MNEVRTSRKITERIYRANLYTFCNFSSLYYIYIEKQRPNETMVENVIENTGIKIIKYKQMLKIEL